MAHWAEIDENNIVGRVIVTENHGTDKEHDWLLENFGGQWVKTSYNTYGGVHYTEGEPSADQTKAFRFNYAGSGYTYDSVRDAFIEPKPFDSWVLNETTCLWEAPVALPDDAATVPYEWDESTTSWSEIVIPDPS
jgi:hypothetical protein